MRRFLASRAVSVFDNKLLILDLIVLVSGYCIRKKARNSCQCKYAFMCMT